MKKLTFFVFLFGFIVVSFSLMDGCSSKSGLSVCTATLPTTASAGAAVTFASCSSPSGTYSWNFGDGTAVVAGDTVTHVYTSTGTYTGTVTVTGSGGTASKNFTVTVINNSWTFKGGTYITDSVVASGGIALGAVGYSGSNRAVLDFVFSALPTTSGNYTIVNAASANVGAGQVYVTLYNYGSGNFPTIYGSTGSGTVNAAVTVSNGKLFISLPSIEVVNTSSAADSTLISAGITQTQ